MHALKLEDYNNIPFLHAPSYFCIPRDALQSAVLAVVEMSVRLSVTVWHCVETQKRITKLSSPRCNAILLVSGDTRTSPKFRRS